MSDLSPIAGLTELRRLYCWEANISDLSPVAGLINLEYINFGGNHVTDIAPLAGLINLEEIRFSGNDVTDISPVARLVNLKTFRTWGNRFSDLSPLARLTKLERVDICGAALRRASLVPLTNLPNLRELYLAGNEITDISLIARLSGLDRLGLNHNRISDLSPLAGLTNLKWLNLHRSGIADLSPLARLSNLTWLDISGNEITDLTPIARLTSVTWLNITSNEITDLTPIARLINLTWLGITNNPIADFSALDGFTSLRDDIPGINAGPKIEGPWLWVFLPTTRHKLNENVDILAEASGGDLTELNIAAAGATKGNAVGDAVWTLDRLPPTGRHNLDDMVGRTLPDGVMYGSILFDSPTEQDTIMHLGSDQEIRVWLNGELVYQRPRSGHAEDFIEVVSITLRGGTNVLLVAVGTRPDDPSNLFIALAADTVYTIGAGIDYVLSEPSIHSADTFTLDIRALNVLDLGGWQFDITFDPSRLEALDVSEGDFLKVDGGSTFFQAGRIDNAKGKIAGCSAARLGDRGARGSGSLLQVEFKAKSAGETTVALQNLELGTITGGVIPAGPSEINFTVEERLATGDVNRDGRVSILDLILVARRLGERVAADSPEDVNGDGIVNIFDLTLVASGIGGAAAPPSHALDVATIEAWIVEARLVDDGSIAFRQGIANLQNLLTALIIPEETALHANYPNPFNPETWIPYQLATPAEVTLTIYDMNGGAVRRFELGHQAAGLYQSRNRAAYWNGRNGRGEFVASGLYFYTLRAGEFTATRKMLIRK